MNELSGIELTSVTIALNENWNLISGITNETSIYSIGDPNNIIIPGTFYAFNESYEQTEILEPGKGYWVRSTSAGSINIGSGRLQKITTPIAITLNNANIISINGAELYFGVDIPEEKILNYSLPPKPPAGAFDVRFSGDWKYCSSEGVIEVMNPGVPLEVEFNVRDEEKWELVNKETNSTFILHGKGKIANPGRGDSFILQKIDGTIISDSFILHSAYPNPFNPVATIQFSVPNVHTSRQVGNVSLRVYDISGRLIESLIDEELDPGIHTVQWDAGNFVSGMYFVRMETGSFISHQKIVLLK